VCARACTRAHTLHTGPATQPQDQPVRPTAGRKRGATTSMTLAAARATLSVLVVVAPIHLAAAQDCAAGKYSTSREFPFADYSSGQLVENSNSELIIQTDPFEISGTVTPTGQQTDAVIWGHDRMNDGDSQFRLDFDGGTQKACQVAEGLDWMMPDRKSQLCSQALPLSFPSRLRVTRDSVGRFKLFVNDTLVSEYLRTLPLPSNVELFGASPADLRIGLISNRAFRIGSHFPPNGNSNGIESAFQGTIRQAVVYKILPTCNECPAGSYSNAGLCPSV